MLRFTGQTISEKRIETKTKTRGLFLAAGPKPAYLLIRASYTFGNAASVLKGFTETHSHADTKPHP